MRKSLIFPVVNAAASRCAVCCWKTGYAAARRTDQPPRRRVRRGWNASCTTSKAPWWRLPTTVTSLITSPAGSSSLTAAKVFRGKATTPRLEQKDQRLAQEASQEAARRKSIEKELEWVRRARKAVSLRAKPARRALKSLTTLNIRNVTKLTNCSFRRPASGR